MYTDSKYLARKIGRVSALLLSMSSVFRAVLKALYNPLSLGKKSDNAFKFGCVIKVM